MADTGTNPPPVPPKDTEASSHDPAVDYVLVFQAIPKKNVRSNTKVPATERSKIADEYSRLTKALETAGLQHTSRQGKAGTGTVLIFVRAHSSTLARAVKAESLHDMLQGVRTAAQPSLSLSRDSSLRAGIQRGDAQSPAERVRHVHDLLTLPPAPPAQASEKDSNAGKSLLSALGAPPGAGLVPKSPAYPHLVDMTPLHDPEFNRSWLARWSNSSSLLRIKPSDLDDVRAHFGDSVALYFGFLNFYFLSLAPAAGWGLVFWLSGTPYHPLYSLGLVIWACVFVEAWRMRERKWAVRWGTIGTGAVERRRAEFRPRKVEIDSATGEQREVFEWWRRELRVVGSIPVMLLFAILLGAVMTTMFVIEVFVAELYDGPGKGVVPLIPTGLFVVCIPQIMAAWQATASALTGWENYYGVTAHEAALTLKMFALQAVVAYGALTLSAFVYVPFGEHIMSTLVAHDFFGTKARAHDLKFEINADRMHKQLFAVSVTSQAINAFTELALPFILRKVNDWREARAEKKNGAKTDNNSGEKELLPASDEEKQFLQRVRKELELPPYDLFGDYAEMATQFGYITLWSVIWPLAPVMGFVNNFFELRSDALKVCLNVRRPVPRRAESVGPWLEVLGFIAWLAALSNSALVYLFQRSEEAHLPGHSSYEATLRTHLHPRNGTASTQSPLSFSHLLPSFLPTSGPEGALIGALLVALASEHAYGLARAGVGHVLERVLWRGSEEETALRAREWQSRREQLAKASFPAPAAGGLAGVAAGEAAASESARRNQDAPAPQPSEGSFFAPEMDVGLQIIRDSGKTD